MNFVVADVLRDFGRSKSALAVDLKGRAAFSAVLPVEPINESRDLALLERCLVSRENLFFSPDSREERVPFPSPV